MPTMVATTQHLCWQVWTSRENKLISVTVCSEWNGTQISSTPCTGEFICSSDLPFCKPTWSVDRFYPVSIITWLHVTLPFILGLQMCPGSFQSSVGFALVFCWCPCGTAGFVSDWHSAGASCGLHLHRGPSARSWSTRVFRSARRGLLPADGWATWDIAVQSEIST